MTLTAGMRSLLGYWGSITSAASTRLGVGGAWQMVKDAGLYTELTGVRPTIQDMNRLYGLATGNRNALETFMAATEAAVISADMIGLTPNARSPLAFQAAPAYNVRINVAYLATGEQATRWFTVQYPGVTLLTLTKGQLLATIDAQVGAFGAAHGITVTTVLTVAISAF